jgi:hypothetical protein
MAKKIKLYAKANMKKKLLRNYLRKITEKTMNMKSENISIVICV